MDPVENRDDVLPEERIVVAHHEVGATLDDVVGAPRDIGNQRVGARRAGGLRVVAMSASVPVGPEASGS